jgi:hypothetical protein
MCEAISEGSIIVICGTIIFVASLLPNIIRAWRNKDD